jgi:hypothetical protein
MGESMPLITSPMIHRRDDAPMVSATGVLMLHIKKDKTNL